MAKLGGFNQKYFLFKDNDGMGEPNLWLHVFQSPLHDYKNA